MLPELRNVKWGESHGARGQHVGAGMLYYAIAYTIQAKRCVCLGSGAGFVPRAMFLAQSQLAQEKIIPGIDTTLVDGHCGPWGLPVDERNGLGDLADVKLVRAKTSDVVDQFSDIDYLHVDADHTYRGATADLVGYGQRMRPGNLWAITLHDTWNVGHRSAPPIGAYQAACDWASRYGHDLVTFPVGCGVTLIMPRNGI